MEESEFDPKKEYFIPNRSWNPPEIDLPEDCINTKRLIDHKVLNWLPDNNNIPTNYKNNLDKNLRNALKELKNNQEIIIRKADKGNLLVILNKTDYINEAENQLNNTMYYRLIEHPITDIKDIMIILNREKYRRTISLKLYKHLMPPNQYSFRKFYTLPKIHKEKNKWFNSNTPNGRPIVSDIGSMTYNISQYIEFKLNSLIKHLPYVIRDSKDFIEKIQNINVTNKLLVTADVESLYTNMLNDRCVSTIVYYLHKHNSFDRQNILITDLLRQSLQANDFTFNEKYYLQISGIAMGKAYSPTLANLYLDCLDQIAATYPGVSFYGRYIDDIFLIFDNDLQELSKLQDKLNSLIPRIKLTFEHSQQSINFLDTTIFKSSKGDAINYKVYFKPTANLNLLHRQSNHPAHIFSGLARSQFIRYKTLSSDYQDYKQSCFNLIRSLTNRGYSYHKLRRIFNRIDFNDKNSLRPADEKIDLIFVKQDWPSTKVLFKDIIKIVRDNLPQFPKIIQANKVDKNLTRLLFKQ